MLDSIHIENYKSIKKLDLQLARINVFIGENGAGKSNILEAIALAGAAQAGKLDNEFLASRGVRVTDPKFMRSAFEPDDDNAPITVRVSESEVEAVFKLINDNQPYSNWTERTNNLKVRDMEHFVKALKAFTNATTSERKFSKKRTEQLRKMFSSAFETFDGKPNPGEAISISYAGVASTKPALTLRPEMHGLADFIIYSPENTALRILTKEGQIEPLGINGEGLLKLLTVMQYDENSENISSVKSALRMFSWFEDFNIPKNNAEGTMNISDRFLYEECGPFDQRSANEGFLFAAFYFALFASKLTPKFFAVDNIDASLNPAFCQELMVRLALLAKENDKQAILTTHNASILDGLDLGDPDQKLFVISRTIDGHTDVTPIEYKPKSEKPVRLSTLFTAGLIGGLANF